MAAESTRPSSAATIGLLIACAVGWRLATVEEMPAWQVSLRADEHGGLAHFKTERLGYEDAGLRNADGVEAHWAPVGTSWRLFLPEPMAAMRSDWRVRVEFAPGAAARAVQGIAIRLNGTVIRDRITAGPALKLTLRSEHLRAGDNELTLESSQARTFRSVRIRNYYAQYTWFPTAVVIGSQGANEARSAEPGWPSLAIVLALGVAAFRGLAGWIRRRLAVPVWTRRQWTRTALGPAAVMIGLSVWNLAGPYQAIFSQWQAVVLVFAYLIVAGAVCTWRNLVSLRWPLLTEAERSRWTERRRSVVLVSAIWLVYNSNLARVGMPDCQPPPLMAISLIRHGSFYADDYRFLHWEGWPVGRVEGVRWVSRWTPGSALFCVPFFLIPTWLGITAPSAAVDILAKVTASTVTALSALFVYGALRLMCSYQGAVWLTLGYALGTASFSMSSQDMWQHGPAQLCVAAAAYLILREDRRRIVHLAVGLCLGLTPVCRPNAAIFAAALALWGARRHGLRVWGWYGLAGLGPVIYLIGYNLHYFGTPGLGGYKGLPASQWIVSQMPWALAGLTISPNRGMFVYSPFLLMAFGGLVAGCRQVQQRWRELTGVLAGAVLAHLLLLSAWQCWHGTFTYGSRYSADAVPFWTLLAGLGIDRILARPVWRRVFFSLVVVSILIQALGVYVNYLEWNWWQGSRGRLTPEDADAAVWDFEHPQILYQVRLLLGLEKGTLHPDW